MNIDNDLKRPFSASVWEKWMKWAMRWFPLPGVGVRLSYMGGGIVISPDVDVFWQHPWTVSMRWVVNTDPKRKEKGDWYAFVKPGFVNGRDVTVTRPATKKMPEQQIPLTDSNPEGLRMSWRNPLKSQGVVATESGDVRALPGEGYPPFFETIGVKPAAKGGDPFSDPDVINAGSEEGRKREIRACDIFLVTPRIATAQDVTVTDPLTASQTVRIDTKFVNDYYRNAPSKHMLKATSKWKEPREPDALERLIGTAVEPQTDEIRIATVWMVSGDDADEDSIPDETWTAYPQYAVFWNLMHASQQEIPKVPTPPITLQTGLLGGMADSIFAGLLSPVNDAFAQIEAFLGAGNFKGNYWSV